MGAPKKYHTEAERTAAILTQQIRYRDSEKGKAARAKYHRHRATTDPTYLKLRAGIERNYRQRLGKAILTARGRASRHKNRIGAMLQQARRRAKLAGLDFSLTPRDIVVPSTCPVLGLSLAFGVGGRGAGSPSLDRFDNNQGYTPENVRVISFRANSLKSDATLEELRAVVRYMEAPNALVRN